jgi:multiple sugar transport system ATP-binding protein
MASITLKHVNKTYVSEGKRVEAVRDLSLEIKDGEFVCLLGPSGCGKTSTLRMIAGLEDISGGEIYSGGRLVNHLTPQERNIAMAFETYALYTHLSVRENILFPLQARKTSRGEMQRRLAAVVEMLDLAEILDRSPGNLSGGQQQRVSLGRAIIREPDVFLLDEPLSHLDITQRIALRARIKRLHSELKSTMVYVTHDQEEAISLADRIAVMQTAELQQVGTREELLDFPENLFVADFIGEPPINLLKWDFMQTNGHLALRSRVANAQIEVPDSWKDYILEKKMQKVILGIRPHDLHLIEEPGDAQLTGNVNVFEFLGEANYAHCSVGSDNVTIVVDIHTFLNRGEQVALFVRPNRIHIFDAESEKCISSMLKRGARPSGAGGEGHAANHQ